MAIYIGCMQLQTQTFYDDTGRVIKVINRQDYLVQDAADPDLQAWREGVPDIDPARTGTAQRDKLLADARTAEGIPAP